MNTWESYYKKSDPENIPWTGVNKNLFEEIWRKFKLSEKGNVLDIGCGHGYKSIYFSKKGFKTIGIDISPTAIKRAKLLSMQLKQKPTFISEDITNFGKISEIKGQKFDVVLDLFTSQFLSESEKKSYLKALSKHLISQKTFYILGTFSKDGEDDLLEGAKTWIKQIAQSRGDIENIYGRYLKILEGKNYTNKKGNATIYIMKAI